MKSFLVVPLLFFFFASALANGPPQGNEKDRKAWAECNATNPVQRDVVKLITHAVRYNDKHNIRITHEEKCFALCYRQKTNALNEDGSIIINPEFIKDMLQISKSLKSSPVLVLSAFQINRLHKDIEDKCEKAFQIFYQFESRMIELALTQEMMKTIMVDGKTVNDDAVQRFPILLEKLEQTLANSSRTELEKINAGLGRNTQL